MQITITNEPFSPWQRLREYEEQLQLDGQYGATAVFVGTMRDFNEGDAVKGMTLEHYPGMTEKELARIADEARARWSLLDGLIIHRVGEIQPHDSIVLLAVWSAHRADAFDASRFLMEALKSRVPFWKKESLGNQGQRWVAQNTPDPGAEHLK